MSICDEKLSFDDIMLFSHDNKEVFEDLADAITRKEVVPVVGAGFSMTTYPSLPRLIELLSSKLHSEEKRRYCSSLVQKGEIKEAINYIERIRTATNMGPDIARIFSPTKMIKNSAMIKKSPGWLLPLLFEDQVITTNIDLMLEFIYQRCGLPFEKVFFPTDFQTIKSGQSIPAPSLYKLYGGMKEDGTLDYTSTVLFPGADIIAFYSKTENKAPFDVLINQKALLFVGCSIQNNYAVNLLSQATENGPINYTIVTSSEKDIDETITSMGLMRIRPIIIPDGRYDAIRLIFDKLLEYKLRTTTGYKKKQTTVFQTDRLRTSHKISAVSLGDNSLSITMPESNNPRNREHNKSEVQKMEKREFTTPTNKVFIVHGHNELLKQSVARLIEKQGLEAVILHEQPNRGAAIIEKFESNKDVGAAISLFTSDDIGRKKDSADEKSRARQNVVFETGYFMGCLGRNKVIIIAEENVELPSDMSGIVYTNSNAWEVEVLKELKAIGFPIDFNKSF